MEAIYCYIWNIKIMQVTIFYACKICRHSKTLENCYSPGNFVIWFLQHKGVFLKTSMSVTIGFSARNVFSAYLLEPLPLCSIQGFPSCAIWPYYCNVFADVYCFMVVNVGQLVYAFATPDHILQLLYWRKLSCWLFKCSYNTVDTKNLKIESLLTNVQSLIFRLRLGNAMF